VPKETNFFIKICQKKDISRKVQETNKAKTPGLILTSSEELVDRWASRETLASVAFFRRLEPRVEETFLAGAFGDFTTGAASWKEGSSAAVASTEGAVAASFFGFLLSLQRKQKAKTPHKSKERERVKDKITSQQKLTSLEGQKVPHLHGEQKAPRQQP
jgi:hypothetical protein